MSIPVTFSQNSQALTLLRFPDLRLPAREATKLRGYFGERFRERSSLFHNHLPDGSFNQDYSPIQYKVIKGIPIVVGFAEGAGELLEIFTEIDELLIDDQHYPVTNKELERKQPVCGLGQELYTYHLLTPWYALNQKNYRKHRNLPPSEQTQLRNTVLIGHLRAFLKGAGLADADHLPILAQARVQPKMVTFDNGRKQMYLGELTTNVLIPDYLGLGKSTSAGFGTVVRIL